VACLTPGIPANLHRNERLIDNDFFSDNKLYIRVKPEDIITTVDEHGNETRKVSLNAFVTTKQSCNRDKYSDVNDVLYNINAKAIENHYNHWAVVSIPLEKLNLFKFKHPQIAAINYMAKPCHDPNDCMYAHTEIIVYNTDDQDQEQAKLPPTVKAQIKANYIDICTIEKL
jgi:hypothetical protein